MGNVETIRMSYDEGYNLGGSGDKIFDSVPQAVNELKEKFTSRSRREAEEDDQQDLNREGLHISKNGEEVEVIKNVEQIKSLDYLTGEQKDFILMHFQLFEASFISNLRNSCSESQNFNLSKAIGNNGSHNYLDIETDENGKVKKITYSKRRIYGYGIDEKIMEAQVEGKVLDQMYLSMDTDITSLRGEKVDQDTVLPKFQLTITSIDHTKSSNSAMIFPKKVPEKGLVDNQHDSLKFFLIDSFIEKIRNNDENKSISDLFLETFSVLATNEKSMNELKREALKMEREILLNNGELKALEKIKYYLNKLLDMIFAKEQFLDSTQNSRVNSFSKRLLQDNSPSKIKGR